MNHRKVFDHNLEQEVTYSAGLELGLIITVAVLLAALIGTLGIQISLGNFPFQAVVYIFTSLVLVHAVSILGWKRAFAYFTVSTVVSLFLELFGVKTGILFGHYYYTEVLDPKLFDAVPLVIPLTYFMVLYPCSLMANLMLRGKINAPLKNHYWSVFAAVLTAIIMTAWDLVMDPVMVHNVKAWVWIYPGQYFGIPFRNFLGWTITTLTCSAIYRLSEPHLPALPLVRGRKAYLMLPILGYGSLMIGAVFIGTPIDTRIIAPFAMGVPLVASLINLYSGPNNSGV